MFPKSAKRSDSISSMKSSGGISSFCGSELWIAKVDGEFGRVSTSGFHHEGYYPSQLLGFYLGSL